MSLVNPKKGQAFMKDAESLLLDLKKKGDASRVEILESILKTVAELNDFSKNACGRLEDIKSSYTLYRDLVITDLHGIVIANSNADRRDVVLGLDVSKEEWFEQALLENDGTQYYAQDVKESIIENQPSLVYSTALRKDGDEKGEIIGVMGVYFDFQGETDIVLNEYLPKNEHGRNQVGWYSLLTSKEGYVIASSDNIAFGINKIPDIPAANISIQEAGKRNADYSIVRGSNSLIVSIKTDGYDEYKGLKWTSHFIMPQASMFKRMDVKDTFGLTAKELMSSKLIPDINKQTYKEIQRNKGDIQLISINGIVLATDLGKAGSSFIPIFDQITETGNSTTGKMEELLSEMASDMLHQNLIAMENYSRQAIDLIDRNLFERAADVRWWSSDHILWEGLQNPSESKYEEMCKRLGIINTSYPMYRDLVVANPKGVIIANSKTEGRDKLNKINVSDQEWFKQSIQHKMANKYTVQDVCKSDLESNELSLIYSSSIIENGAREGNAVGVIGIFFDWNVLSRAILDTCVPLDDKGNHIEEAAAFYCSRS